MSARERRVREPRMTRARLEWLERLDRFYPARWASPEVLREALTEIRECWKDRDAANRAIKLAQKGHR